MAQYIADKKYQQYQFEVKAVSSNIAFNFSFSNEKLYTNCYIYDENGIIVGDVCNLFNFTNQILIGENTTINGLNRKLNAGTYKLVVINSKEEKQIVEMDIVLNSKDVIDGKYLSKGNAYDENNKYIEDNEYLDKAHRYYKGDFHAHSTYSDGRNTYVEIKSDLLEYGLDFIAMTEHNVIPYGKMDIGVLNVPSFEWTFPSGHINIHGAKKLYNYDINDMPNYLDPKEILEYYSDCNRCICHPFLDEWSFNLYDTCMADIDTIELITDPSYPTSSVATGVTLKFFDYIWRKGYKIFAIGGSDCHLKKSEKYEGAISNSVFGTPSTYAYCKGLSSTNIVDASRNGHSYITMSPVLDIDINNNTIIPGGEISPTYVEYKVTTTPSYGRYTARFIKNGRVVLKKELEDGFIVYEDILVDEDSLRFDIIDDIGDLICFINPIYVGKREKYQGSYGELVKGFDIND